MTRVASLTLPFLSIERLRQLERAAGRRERAAASTDRPSRITAPIDDNPGACSVPRGGGWRPGARWARSDTQVDLPTYQRPIMREMGRRSEAADHPFRAMPADEGASGGSMIAAPAGRIPAFDPDRLPWHRPMALITRSAQREVISAACPLALQLGLSPGMAAAHARALVSDLEIREAEPEKDADWLQRLALHALGHWTPTVAVSGTDGLWFDLTGTTHLFGGEARFCRRLLRFLSRLGYSAGIAVAGTAGGRHRSALTAVVTRYRTRGAVAEVGKALGLPRDLTKMLTGLVWGWSAEGITDEQIESLNLNAKDYRLRLCLDLSRQLIGTNRQDLDPILFAAGRVDQHILEIARALGLPDLVGDRVDHLLIGQRIVDIGHQSAPQSSAY